jgi:hypothetical protein
MLECPHSQPYCYVLFQHKPWQRELLGVCDTTVQVEAYLNAQYKGCKEREVQNCKWQIARLEERGKVRGNSKWLDSLYRRLEHFETTDDPYHIGAGLAKMARGEEDSFRTGALGDLGFTVEKVKKLMQECPVFCRRKFFAKKIRKFA